MVNRLDNSNISKQSSIINYLLNFSTEAKEQLYKSISYVINKQNSSKETIPIHVVCLGSNALRYIHLINQRNIYNFIDKQKREYTLANLLRDKDDDRCLLNLYFNEQNKIEKINIKNLRKKKSFQIQN